tara:strand:+ start:147 stop:626 length:480 start_codon:yes stop_codon:yes gene_type:complete
MTDPKKEWSERRLVKWFTENKDELGRFATAALSAIPGGGAVASVAQDVLASQVLTEQKQYELEAMVMKYRTEVERNTTSRWKSDNTTSERLTKLVRPVSLLSLLAIIFLFTFLDGWDGWGFDAPEAYVDMIQSLAMLAFGAYFGGRSMEKIQDVRHGHS